MSERLGELSCRDWYQFYTKMIVTVQDYKGNALDMSKAVKEKKITLRPLWDWVIQMLYQKAADNNYLHYHAELNVYTRMLNQINAIMV